jgi:hypothetical protein
VGDRLGVVGPLLGQEAVLILTWLERQGIGQEEYMLPPGGAS